jgi:hypothetical protein
MKIIEDNDYLEKTQNRLFMGIKDGQRLTYKTPSGDTIIITVKICNLNKATINVATVTKELTNGNK